MTTHSTPPTTPHADTVSITTRMAASHPTTKDWYTVEVVATLAVGATDAQIAAAMRTAAQVQVAQDALLSTILSAYLDGEPADGPPLRTTHDAPPAPARLEPADVVIHVGNNTGRTLGTVSDTALTTYAQGTWPNFGQHAGDADLKRAALQLLNARAAATAASKHPAPAASPPPGPAPAGGRRSSRTLAPAGGRA